MVYWVKQSIKKHNEEKEKEAILQEQITELQNALLELASVVSDNVVAQEENTNG